MAALGGWCLFIASADEAALVEDKAEEVAPAPPIGYPRTPEAAELAEIDAELASSNSGPAAKARSPTPPNAASSPA